jgi:chromosome segregation ATPase
VVADQATAASRGELARALAQVETLRSASASERAARAQAEATTTDLRSQLDDLQAQLAESLVARAAAEELHETTRQELENALVQVEISSRQVDAEHAPSVKLAAMADELGVRVGALDADLRKARLSAVPPVNAEVDELRAVIELQEQALEAASAREQALPGSRNPKVGNPETTRSYPDNVHVLFAQSTEGYELFERSGPAPPIGSIVEVSGGRTCRVMRLGPSPFPGGLEACAYLDPA